MSQKVKKVVTRFSTPDDHSYVSEVTEFDLNGSPIMQAEYSEEGELESKVVSKYNEKGLLVEQIQFLEEEEISDHRFFIRDENGELLRTEILFQDGSKSIITKTLDLNSKEEETKELDEDGELESREVNYLDEDQNIILKEIFNHENKMTEAFKYTYNEAGQLSRREQLDHRKKLILYTEYNYDENGRNISRGNFNRKGKLSDFIKIEYDTKGQVTKQIFSGNFFFQFEYDTNGNTVLEERFNAAQELEYQSRFEYDSENRLLREINLQFSKELTYEFFD